MKLMASSPIDPNGKQIKLIILRAVAVLHQMFAKQCRILFQVDYDSKMKKIPHDYHRLQHEHHGYTK